MHEKVLSAYADRRILCVDDDSAILRVRQSILEQQGYVVIVADQPDTVLQQDLSSIDLVLLDYDMSAINGRDLFLRIRAAGAICPIMLVSGCIDTLPAEVRVLFTTCIEKGRPVDELVGIIQAHLRQAAIPDPH